MALIYMSGFESGVLEDIWTGGVYGDVFLCPCSTYFARSGSYSLEYDQLDGGGRALPTSLSEVYFQFANYFIPYIGTNNYTNIYFRNGSVVIFTIHVAVLGRLYCRLGSYGTLLASVTTRQDADECRVYEIHLKIHPTEGVLEIKVDGVLEASYYGNTKHLTYNDFDRFDLPGKTSGTVPSYIDDIVFNDPSGDVNNSWPGGLKIVRLPPTGDGAFKQWTPTPAGLTHYTIIDERPPSATDYLSTNTSSTLDTYTHLAMPSDALTTGRFILQNDIWVKRSGVSDSGSIVPSIRIGPSNFFSTPIELPEVYDLVSGVWEMNPAGSTWDISTINNLEFGFQT